MTESLLHRCRSCGRYTLFEACPACHGPVGTPHPARFSPEDRYGRYRRALLAARTGEPAP
jgi:H/ACA ribonucleoprotein complex subunit 3